MQIKIILFGILILLFACRQNSLQNPVNTNPKQQEKNIYLKGLKICGLEPMTGFYRNGYCQSREDDTGVHSVCAIMTDDFLRYSYENGNDLISEKPGQFPGLKTGDRWCICAEWWKAAEANDLAPPVDLDATHAKTLWFIEKDLLEQYQ